MWSSFLAEAKDTALAAGGLALEYFGGKFRIDKKGDIDLVTEADLAVEKYIYQRLRAIYPEHGFLMEESDEHHSGRKYVWVVDPIDGTTNFAHGYPFFSISIALRHKEKEVLGVVFAPAMGELFWAMEGAGSWLNDNRIYVSNVDKLIDSMLVTGFPYDVQNRYEDVIRELEWFLREAQAVRRDGSAALDLCYVASGRFDGFWERRLHAWDTAAGSLIIKEAGGRVTRYNGESFSIFHQEILASNGKIHPLMMDVLNRPVKN